MKKLILCSLFLPAVFLVSPITAQWHTSGNVVSLNNINRVVGIGTNTPAGKLEVRRDNSFLIAKFTNAATTGDRTALIDIQNGSGTLWRYGVGGLNNGLGLNAGQFYLERFGIGSVLTINTAGRVGIGTNAPIGQLQVNRNDGALLARFTNSAPANFDRTALIDIINGSGVLWRYGVGGANNGLGLNAGQFYIERSGIGSVLTINTAGSVGIGANNPAAKLEVLRNSGFLVAKFTNAATSGDGTALIDIQNSAGTLWRYGVGGANNGLGLNAGQFYIERGGIGSVLTINTAGSVGIGVNAPSEKLQVAGNVVPDVNCNRSLGTSGLRWNSLFLCNNPVVFASAKRDVQNLSYGLKEVLQLRPISYKDEQMKIGLIAQEVQKVVPEMVSVAANNLTDKSTSKEALTTGDNLGLDYNALLPVLVKAIQEQQAMIRDRDQQLNDLKNQLDQIKGMLVNKGLLTGNEISNGSFSKAMLSIAPNPATDRATIRYYLPENVGSGSIQVVAPNGAIVKVYSGLQKGNGQLTISAKEFATGIYSYHLIAGGSKVASTQMVLSR
ncbi:tail fiber domain-containing protein [Segetibacter koreensis]|uniref:tail fiber domain-containing protein n=1 Tax=Segetibacter koreensis TaxID=398037 RepID=UPI000361DB41|nr:tail fiber domain-containing protein [Segetibacter koreensis]